MEAACLLQQLGVPAPTRQGLVWDLDLLLVALRHTQVALVAQCLGVLLRILVALVPSGKRLDMYPRPSPLDPGALAHPLQVEVLPSPLGRGGLVRPLQVGVLPSHLDPGAQAHPQQVEMLHHNTLA